MNMKSIKESVHEVMHSYSMNSAQIINILFSANSIKFYIKDCILSRINS